MSSENQLRVHLIPLPMSLIKMLKRSQSPGELSSPSGWKHWTVHSPLDSHYYFHAFPACQCVTVPFVQPRLPLLPSCAKSSLLPAITLALWAGAHVSDLSQRHHCLVEKRWLLAQAARLSWLQAGIPRQQTQVYFNLLKFTAQELTHLKNKNLLNLQWYFKYWCLMSSWDPWWPSNPKQRDAVCRSEDGLSPWMDEFNILGFILPQFCRHCTLAARMPIGCSHLLQLRISLLLISSPVSCSNLLPLLQPSGGSISLPVPCAL